MASIPLPRPAPWPAWRGRLERARRGASEAIHRPGHAYRRHREAAQRAARAQGPYATVARIADGVLTLTNGAHRAVLAVRGAAWSRLAEASQDALLDQYAWWAATLAHPVQWTVQVRPDALDAQADALEATGVDGPARAFAAELAAYLRTLGPERGLRRRRYLLTVPSDHLDGAAAREQLRTRCADLALTLQRIGLDGTRLDDTGLAGAVRDCWYPGVAAPVGNPVPPDWTPSGVARAAESLYIDHGDGSGHWLRGLVLTWPPAQLTGAWLAPVLTMDVPVDLAIHLAPRDAALYQDDLRERLQQLRTAQDFLALKAWMPWQGLGDAVAHHAQTEAALEHQQTRPFSLSVALLVRAATLPALETATERVEKELRGMGGRWRRATKAHDLAARTCRPEGVEALGTPLEVDLATVAHLLPALTATVGD